MRPVAVIAITRNGAQLGSKIAGGLAGSKLYVLRKYHGAATCKALPFDELRSQIESCWHDGNDLVCIMATGIVVRILAPLLEAKDSDPAVVVMDDAAKFSISLLSGHLGGANELAERCAWLTGARAVITTATDVNNLPSFDMLARENDWGIDEIQRVKSLNSLLLDHRSIAVVDPTGRTRTWFHGKGNLAFFETIDAALGSGASGFVFVTNRHLPLKLMPETLLILRPKTLVLGIGCNSGTSADEIEQFVSAQLRRILLSTKSIRLVASASAKENEAGLIEFAKRMGAELVFFPSSQLNRIKTPTPPSQQVLSAIGANGVAEPAAILASGGGRLLLKKVKSDNVTLAIAEFSADNCVDLLRDYSEGNHR